MTKPETLNAILSLVRRSELVAEDRLRTFLAGVRGKRLVDLTPDTLLDHMVEANLLTAFQAEQLRNGRYQGFRLGNYRILDRIGSGGMGQVFLAEKDNTGMRVAIKVLRQQAYKAPKAFERFAREATISARLAHPNIVRVFDFHAGSQPPYLVMEYVDGISLQAAVAQTGPVAWGEAAHIGQQVALGLQHAHEAGLVHRDIKPANLLVDRHGGVKILDLGIVRVEGGESITQMVDEQLILGTIEYLSPEQAVDSHHVDIRADLYSLGATLYFLLAGRPPFAEGSTRAKLLRLHSVAPESIRTHCPEIPDNLAAIVHRLLAKAPDDRYPTPRAAAAALAPWVDLTAEFPTRLFHANKTTTQDCLTPMQTQRQVSSNPTPLPIVLDDVVTRVIAFDDLTPVVRADDQSTLCTQIREASKIAPALAHIADRYAARPPMSPRRKRNVLFVMWCAFALFVLAGGVQVYKMVRAKSTIVPASRSR